MAVRVVATNHAIQVVKVRAMEHVKMLVEMDVGIHVLVGAKILVEGHVSTQVVANI